MTNETFRKAIAEALDPEYAAMIPEHDEHIFSERFERKMQKLIRRRSKPYYMLISTGLRRVACVIIMFLIVSFSTVMSVEALRKPFLDFLASIFSDHTTIESVLELEGEYPKTIEERYEITEGLEDYYIEKKVYDDNLISVSYRSYTNKSLIVFNQATIEQYESNINTENTSIVSEKIGEYYAIAFNTQDYFVLIWNNGDYIFELSSNIGQNALINIAESVKKVE